MEIVNRIAITLIKGEFYEKGGELLEQAGEEKKSLECYRRGKCFRRGWLDRYVVT